MLKNLFKPRSGGRIGDAALGARLLVTDDEAEAQQIAETLERLCRIHQPVHVGLGQVHDLRDQQGLAGDPRRGGVGEHGSAQCRTPH